jgi:hypothetical protein
MDGILRGITVAVLLVFELASLLFFRLGILMFRYPSIRLGNCRFWGPHEFLVLSQNAMQLLEREDPILAATLREKRAWFWYCPSKLSEVMFRSGVFSVSDGYIDFGEAGLAARLVWANFRFALFQGKVFLPSERGLWVQRKLELKALTKAWLADHKFPEPLVNIFS